MLYFVIKGAVYESTVSTQPVSCQLDDEGTNEALEQCRGITENFILDYLQHTRKPHRAKHRIDVCRCAYGLNAITASTTSLYLPGTLLFYLFLTIFNEPLANMVITSEQQS